MLPKHSQHELKSAFVGVLDDLSQAFTKALAAPISTLISREVGTVLEIGEGIAVVAGLPGVQSEELILFSEGTLGLAFNLDKDGVGVVLLGSPEGISAGDEARRTGRVMDVPVGHALLGRVVDPTGRPLDQRGPISSVKRLPIERVAPPVLVRAPVERPLQTGIKLIDSLFPIGRGQRELILGDRQTGKTALALDTILNQQEQNVLCLYCAIGQRSDSVAQIIESLSMRGALKYTVVVVATEDDPVGLRFAAPYAATSIAEYFMEQGQDVLVVYDDLTRHARAYRELSLLLKRPPGREAYPGDIFYLHARLLERATQLRSDRGAGSLTALPIIETQAQNLAAYIPTNLISITDGQIFLSTQLFQYGVLPAVDVGRSVSRVGGKAQLPAYRKIVGDLRLAFAQFEELERFSRYGAHLDESSQLSLAHGKRIREVLKQDRYTPCSVPVQLSLLYALNHRLLDNIPLTQLAATEQKISKAIKPYIKEIFGYALKGETLTSDKQKLLLQVLNETLKRENHGDT